MDTTIELNRKLPKTPVKSANKHWDETNAANKKKFI